MKSMDVHSFSAPDRARVRHLDLNLQVDFSRKVLEGSVGVRFDLLAGDEVILDTRGLEVRSVENAISWELGAADAILGKPLRIRVTPGTREVIVRYATTPSASGLQWLEPAQTAGKRHPFLFTQSQAIHARSWIPLQDSPGVRVTFAARISTTTPLRAVMGAVESDGVFRMDHPIPSYLISLAAGEIARREIGPRSAVYAEPALLDAAAHEFEDTESMIQAVESLYSPYRWGRYDILVLPPSFPFGGMENPCLTFATPTILAGDKSLVSLVAHELAHSWSGNLVTNATWSDFWLNEGFTVYVERRVIEEVYGPRRAEMEAVLARGELDKEFARLPERDRVLHVDLAGRDPDDGCTLVPYEKGALMLRTIEKAVGREPFDKFLRAYFDRFAFQSITTAQFVEYLREAMPNPVPVDEWIHRPGVPAGADEPHSDGFDHLTWPAPAWTTHEWLHFLRWQDDPDMKRLDGEFHLTESGNAEILHQWLMMSLRFGYQPAMTKLEQFLCSVGRRKFVKPLYSELMKTDPLRARAIYAKARVGYHPIAQGTIDEIVGWRPPQSAATRNP
jgi:aminopeptidase N